MPQPPDRILTLAARGEAEIRVQRSRFLAWVAPAPDEKTARTVIAEARRRFHDARHVCHAWRLGRVADPLEVRNDDGEPAGTAGEPVLAVLRRADLTDVVGVVVRWFGGVKLGTGGLARAYGEAAATALSTAPRREVLLGRDFELTVPYPLQKTIAMLLAAHDGRLVAQEFGETVSWRVQLPHSRWEGFADAVTEATAGAVSLQSATAPDPQADL